MDLMIAPVLAFMMNVLGGNASPSRFAQPTNRFGDVPIATLATWHPRPVRGKWFVTKNVTGSISVTSPSAGLGPTCGVACRNLCVTGLDTGPPRPFVALGPCLHRTAPTVTPDTVGLRQPLVRVSPFPSKKNWARTQELPVQVGLVVSTIVTNAPLGPSPLVTIMTLCFGSKDGSSARSSPQGFPVGSLLTLVPRAQSSMLVTARPVRTVPNDCVGVASPSWTGSMSVSRLKTFRVESPSLTQRLPSLPPGVVGGVTTTPLGPEASLKLLMRSGSQQTDPTKPPLYCPMGWSLMVSKTAMAACDRSVT